MDINVSELKKRRTNGEKFIFIDVREPDEYADFNLGAQLIPLGNLTAALASLEAQKNEEIVLHCRSGKRSAMAQQMMQQAGFTNVRNLEGGVLAWMSEFGR